MAGNETTLSPAFTSSKMRAMFNLVNDCAKQFVNFYKEQSVNVITIEMKDSFTRFANDVIATCAFGITCDSLKNKENDFYLHGQEATNNGFVIVLKIIFTLLIPKIATIFKLTFFTRRVNKFFKNIIAENIRVREENNIVRPDMIHLLMEARKGRLKHEVISAYEDSGFSAVKDYNIGKNENSIKTDISDEDIAAQALLFFFAGFKTVSTQLCFMAHEIAINPYIQRKLIEEVDQTSYQFNGSLTYDALSSMKYMDMVISETLRKWPPTVTVDRVCVKSYTIQPTKPNESPIHLKVGDTFWLPILGIHHDTKYYSEPEKFDPERFSDENKHKIRPFTYMPFGSGPRNCIGSRLALMEIKTIFFHIFSNFEFTIVEKTQIPIKICRKQTNVTAENGFWLGLKSRTQ